MQTIPQFRLIMNKVAKIKTFVDLDRINNSLIVNKCTPLFEKLLRNVKKEYKKFHNNREPKINNLEVALNNSAKASTLIGYLENQHFIDAYTQFKENQELPFSITQEIQCRSASDQGEIRFPSQHILRTTYFVSNSFSREMFHQIQRQHKIWWMTYGASPGKYSISDQRTDSFSKYVNIRSNVEDLQMDVERLKLFSLKDCIRDKEALCSFLSRVPNRKKEVIPDVIEATVELQTASLALLLDAVNLSEDYTAFHRRSAPYQIALLVNEPSADLIDLARYIELLVNVTEPEIEILNESKTKVVNERNWNMELAKLDEIGIPYSIMLNQNSLKAGLLKLRNRNTTLSETIHLSDVTSYVIKIFNSG